MLIDIFFVSPRQRVGDLPVVQQNVLEYCVSVMTELMAYWSLNQVYLIDDLALPRGLILHRFFLIHRTEGSGF